MIHILLNPLSNNGRAVEAEEKIKNYLKNQGNESEIKTINITTVKSAAEICKDIPVEDTIIVAGGDGTITHFVNDVYELKLQQKILLYFCGSGNDFMNDVKDLDSVKDTIKDNFIPLNQFMESLPKVTVNDETRYFINGIGFGIDGYCCEEGDKVRATSDKPVNYTSIAIGGLLGKYHPANATVTVDGVKKEYKRVWLAPTMLGRFYGGGMMVAPNQNRLNEEHIVTNVVWSKAGKIRTLMAFPSIFKGEHLKYTKMIDVQTGHEVSVEFDRPCALQIDGETIRNVTSYKVEYK